MVRGPHPPLVVGQRQGRETVICENCGGGTARLQPCPCELIDECPIAYGICDRCRRLITRNAVARRYEHRRAA